MAPLRGFATWRPTEESEQLLAAIGQVLEEYEDYLPMTGRQIFYRLVGAFGYEKSERAANKLYGVLGRARRAGMIHFSAVRDGGGTSQLPLTYGDAAGFWDETRKRRDHYRRDRQADQPAYVELYCESPGMLQQLVNVAFPYSVPVYGTRGFAGLSVTAEIARRALTRHRDTVLIQVGDYDPSGRSIFESLSGGAAEFVRQVTRGASRDANGWKELPDRLGLDADEITTLELRAVRRDLPMLRAVRAALTLEQVEEHDLPTAPVSRTKSGGENPHAADWVGETAQLEAMPPDLLARTVRDAIKGELDMEVYQETLGAEGEDLESIDETLESVP